MPNNPFYRPGSNLPDSSPRTEEHLNEQNFEPTPQGLVNAIPGTQEVPPSKVKEVGVMQAEQASYLDEVRQIRNLTTAANVPSQPIVHYGGRMKYTNFSAPTGALQAQKLCAYNYKRRTLKITVSIGTILIGDTADLVLNSLTDMSTNGKILTATPTGIGSSYIELDNVDDVWFIKLPSTAMFFDVIEEFYS